MNLVLTDFCTHVMILQLTILFASIGKNEKQTFKRARWCIWAWSVKTSVPRMRKRDVICRKAATDVQNMIVRPCPWTLKI